MITAIFTSIIYSCFILGTILPTILPGFTSQTQSNKNNLVLRRRYTTEDGQIVDIDKLLMTAESPWPKPQEWLGYSYQQMWKHFHCRPYSNDRNKPMPTEEDFKVFQDAYKKYVDPTKQFNDPILPTVGYTFKDGQPPPFMAKRGKRGRGLFSTRRIKEGEIIHDGEIDSVLFPDPASFREFIFSLPRNRACDELDWVWTQRESGEDPLKLYTAFTITVLWNGEWINKERRLGNTTVNVNPESSFSSKFIALRDIDEGEELLFNYGIYETDYKAVGL